MSPAMSIFPDLPLWAQTLATILPLSALIEFVDVATELHAYQLRSSVRWNWPVTPAGARLLLSEDDTSACCLDQPQRSIALQCLDGRYGNQYPCSNPTTTRLWVSTHKVDHLIQNVHKNMKDPTARKQSLRIVHLRDMASSTTNMPEKSSIFEPLVSDLRTRNFRYLTVSSIGWLCWTVLVVLGFAGGLYIAGTYLLLMPLTGLVVGLTHGNTPKRPLKRNVGQFKRLIVAAGNLNALNWFAFYGSQTLLNGLLNLPLRRSVVPGHGHFRWLLRLVIVAQWALVLASCAGEGWNAFIISMWVAFCIFMSAYGYPPDVAARDWLRRNCMIAVETIDTELSERQAMLNALVAINPDTKEGRTNWMDPILASSPERLATLLKYLEDGDDYDASAVEQNYWWKYVVEGVEIGKKIKILLEDKSSSEA
jgi:hypothetical protein